MWALAPGIRPLHPSHSGTRPMKRILAVAISLAIAFAFGAPTDRLLSDLTTPKVAQPIQTDLCFYAKNSGLFAGREFSMKARVETSMHFVFLTSPACPNSAVPFGLPEDESPERSTIEHHISPFDHSIVLVAFKGTTLHRTLLNRLRAHFQPAPTDGFHELIVMNRIIAVDVKE